LLEGETVYGRLGDRPGWLAAAAAILFTPRVRRQERGRVRFVR
jgi:hypothetical protein